MMKLVMGLGNPGEQYKNHRHNVGYMILDRVAKKLNVELDIKKKKTVFGKGKSGKIEYLLLKPQTFMNLSGEAALYMASFMKITVENIIVIYDDTDIAIGEFRVIPSTNDESEGDLDNSDIDHNGVISIRKSLKSYNFTKIGVGISACPEDEEKADFLLAPFTKDERKKIRDISENIVEAVCTALFESPQAAKKKYSL
ncbi:aminoacyl-tRNA hydrolase [Brachyspira sp.]|uniref:aminoacyl-tRNA hydrolase n=1 Tax=Brachyspira sp. TaxID=1977261 RepID=UPI002614B674|nr:aminoacyl-tRNA hydrolase [Brachyspira sp.]